MASDDEEWVPPKLPKPKPKNFALLEAKKKKTKNKTSQAYFCDKCGKKLVSREQMKDHKKRVHGMIVREL